MLTIQRSLYTNLCNFLSYTDDAFPTVTLSTVIYGFFTQPLDTVRTDTESATIITSTAFVDSCLCSFYVIVKRSNSFTIFQKKIINFSA